MGLRVGARVLPCAIGRAGVAGAKREGDGATPRGRHRIIGCYYRPDRVAPPNAWARPIGPRDLWSDDPRAADYNRPVRAPYAPSHESMRRGDRQYDIVLITDWNAQPPEPDRGSAIFLHIWRKPRHPTAGCIALSRQNITWLASRIRIGTELHVS